MTKRKVSFVLLACLSVVMVILMAVPMGATAASGVTSAQWSGAAFMGIDNYYSTVTNIVAFRAGSTARLTVQVYNDEGVDITIKEAKLKFDWGGVFAATAAPTQLKDKETGVFTFEFTVPEVAVASNTIMHSYQVVIGFQKQGTGYVNSTSTAEYLGTGDNTTQDFTLANVPVLASSVKVYWRDTVPNPDTVSLRDASSYVLNAWSGRLTFGTAPQGDGEAFDMGDDTRVYADYQYFENAGTGDGVNKVFYTNNAPLVDGSLKVYVGNTVTEAFTEATGWTVDLETGKVTLASAPSSFENVYVTYEYWTRMAASGSATGNNFVVYSADQADASSARQTYNSMSNNYPNYIFTPGTEAAKAAEVAQVAKEKADAEYKDGDFTAAEADYNTAITSLQSAIDTDATLNTTVQSALVGLLGSAEPVIDAYAAKLNGEAKQANGQASMYKNVGVFTILLGVATLLAGLGGILWAYSRLVEAKGPKTQ